MKTLCPAEENKTVILSWEKLWLETDEYMWSSNAVFWMKTEWETELKTLNRYQQA